MRLRLPKIPARGSSSRRFASGAALSLIASTLVLLAFQADGSPISDVDLNDGSVWVTNLSAEDQMVGRLNPQIQQLDLGIKALSSDFDVHQTASTVLLDVRTGGRSLRRIDVAAGKAGDPVALSPTTAVSYGGATVALVDQDNGHVWIRDADTVQGFVFDQTEEDLDAGVGAVAAVGTDGVAYVVSQEKRSITPVDVIAGVPAKREPLPLSSELSDRLAATVVGDVPVVFDRQASTLQWPEHEPVKVDMADAESARLQQPGAARAGVLLATTEGLLEVDLESGQITELRSGLSGPPAAPVVLDGFVHAAWADPTGESYVRLGAGEPHAERIPGVSASARLVFRVNRHVVVLNDVSTGVSWLVQEDGLPRVDNWKDVDPSQRKEQTEDPDPDKAAKTRRTQENRPPIARDDRLGVRPGQDSIVPVTRNDVDLDGDILTVDSIKNVKQVSGPKPQRLDIVGGGTQLQARFGPNDGGKTARFTYTVSDGREDGTDEATLEMPIVPLSQNRPPRLVEDQGVPRQTSISVAKGQRTSAFVLPDWEDPDGDSLTLLDARVREGGSVTFRNDGVVEFVDDGLRAGAKTVELTISDGHPDGVRVGKLTVNVVPRPSVPPVLTPDRAVGIAGNDILVKPLLNDYSRDGSALHLRGIVPLGGVEVTQDPVAGTFVARAGQPGTYYLDYAAYSDRGEAQSFVRLDVLAKSDTDQAPVAMQDRGLLPPSGTVLVDLLANDYDPEGGVLAVTSVEVPPGSPVKASLVQNRLLRLESSRDLEQPVSVNYTLSDGVSTAEGSVSVGQAVARPDNRPPVAAVDRLTVRAGAVASVPVLANDFDPDGDQMTLFQQDLVMPKGLPLFVSGTSLRFRAPAKEGEVRASYGIRDARGQRDDAELIIDVIADDPERNSAPRPDPVVARAVGERPVRVDLELQGSDPDGDAVTLKGLVTSPKLGRVTEIGLDWLSYEPLDVKRGGTDAFEAEVQDKYGKTARVQIRVGVVGRAPINQPPVALDDTLLVRPDRVIQFGVTGNDADPDGDPIVLDEKLSGDADAVVEDGFVTVDIPAAKGDAAQQIATTYTVADGLGGQDTARFTIDASPDAPLYAPVTKDDAASLADVAGKSPGESVRIDVLANDGDLDGRREDLTLAAFDKKVSRVAKGQLDVRLAAHDQVIVYEVGDAEGNTSFGFAFVSGTETVPPVIDPAADLPVKVDAGESITLNLDDYVQVRAGRKPILTLGDRVVAARYAGAAKAAGKDALKFTAPKDSSGRSAITFEVTDGESLNDPTGLTALLTVPVDIKATQNQPPQLRNAEVQVVAGDEAAEKTLDLRPLATDPNPEDAERLTFTAQSSDAVQAQIRDGALLVLNAAEDAQDGQVEIIPITVEDPKGARAEAMVRVRVVRSDKPLVQVGQIGPLETDAGVPVSFDINSYATNPYEGVPLTVSGIRVESGETSAATASGGRISVTPAERFSGRIGVRFTVHDGSDDPQRDVTGRVEVVVVAAPEPPSKPTVTNMTHNSVTLSWKAGDDKGSRITGYEVLVNGGDARKCGDRTSCPITGLSPGKTYSFKVVASNRVGPSEPSPSSDPVTPDRVPERMAPVTIAQDYAQRDKQLTLQWNAPGNEGSAIRHYEIHRLGTADVRTATASPFIWSGLTNGESVQFEIRAVNDIVDEARKQQWSDASSADKAFAVPNEVPKATATATHNDGVPGGKVSVA